MSYVNVPRQQPEHGQACVLSCGTQVRSPCHCLVRGPGWRGEGDTGVVTGAGERGGQWEDGQACACTVIGIQSGVDGESAVWLGQRTKGQDTNKQHTLSFHSYPPLLRNGMVIGISHLTRGTRSYSTPCIHAFPSFIVSARRSARHSARHGCAWAMRAGGVLGGYRTASLLCLLPCPHIFILYIFSQILSMSSAFAQPSMRLSSPPGRLAG